LSDKIIFKLISNSNDINFKRLIEHPAQTFLSQRSAIWLKRQSILSLGWFFVALAIIVFLQTLDEAEIFVLLFLSAGLFLLFLVNRSTTKELLGGIQNSPLRLGETVYSLSEDGIDVAHPACSTKLNWAYVSQVDMTHDSLLLCFGKYDRVPISRKAFKDAAHFEAVYRQCTVWSSK